MSKDIDVGIVFACNKGLVNFFIQCITSNNKPGSIFPMLNVGIQE